MHKMRLSATVLLAAGLLGCTGERPATLSQQSVSPAVPVAAVDHHHSAATTQPAADRPAPLFDDLGHHHHPVSTSSPLAQRYFDQGLTLAYGFNHEEAARSFRAAAAVDLDLAMAWWGVALAYGPNINRPMTDDDVPKAWSALQKALELSPNASQKERDYIQALANRYTAQPVKDRSALDKAYADAMVALAQRYPDDLDAATLAAEAIMDTMPWNYWTKDLQPRPGTEQIVELLERVLAANPQHPGATHYYIHAMELPHPRKALAAADTLNAGLVPGAGHLVHMPAHIYLRLGLYDEAFEVNERASQADESYISQCRAQGFYPATYYPHNVHFLWYTAAMLGRSRESIAAASAIDQQAHHHQLSEGDRFSPLLLMTLTRFGRWEQVLQQPQPPEKDLFASAMSRFARGLAFANTNRLDDAQRELKSLERIAASKEAQSLDSDILPAGQLVQIVRHALAGEIAMRSGRADEGIRQLQTAVKLEDDLPYMEPPFAFFPLRHYLGAALLEANRPAEAEAVYREDLVRHPHNGWALLGLSQALAAQGKADEAELAQNHLDLVWVRADIQPASSRF